MSTVLFVCLHNAGRSQMSEALFERLADARHAALSAGTTPDERVHPEVVEVMQELGIDLSDRKPRLLTRELAEQAGLLLLCAPYEMPIHPRKAIRRLGVARPQGAADRGRPSHQK